MSALVLEPVVEPTPADRPSRRRSWVYVAILSIAVAAALYATAVPLMLQRSGTQLVTITSGSMTPLFPVGSTISEHKADDPTALQPGQIITFRSLGNGTVITHRIIEVIDRPELGEVHYKTKGDANASADPDLAPASHVIGVAEGVLPAWQAVAVNLQTPRGRLLVYGSLFLVIAVGELSEIIAGLRRRTEEES